MSQTGVFNSNESLDISTFYEMSIFCNMDEFMMLNNKPNIFVSNDSSNWFLYRYLNSSYMYLSDLMANYIKIESEQPLTLHYNANLKK